MKIQLVQRWNTALGSVEKASWPLGNGHVRNMHIRRKNMKTSLRAENTNNGPHRLVHAAVLEHGGHCDSTLHAFRLQEHAPIPSRFEIRCQTFSLQTVLRILSTCPGTTFARSLARECFPERSVGSCSMPTVEPRYAERKRLQEQGAYRALNVIEPAADGTLGGASVDLPRSRDRATMLRFHLCNSSSVTSADWSCL